MGTKRLILCCIIICLVSAGYERLSRGWSPFLAWGGVVGVLAAMLPPMLLYIFDARPHRTRDNADL